jgi:hypothetical protein
VSWNVKEKFGTFPVGLAAALGKRDILNPTEITALLASVRFVIPRPTE